MMRAEIRGTLRSTPARLTTGARVSVRAVVEFTEGGQCYTASLIATDPRVCTMLCQYRRGDRLTVKGEATPRSWNDRGG
jgi:hypothetical protein